MDGVYGDEAPRYEEIQHFRQAWLWVVILLLAALAWWAFVQQVVFRKPFGNRVTPDAVVWFIWLLFGLGLPRLAFVFRFEIRVDDEKVDFGFRPLHRRRIRLEEIEDCEAVSYRPIREYMGWGLRWMPKRGWCYTVSGNEGVRVALRDGRKVLIGSRRAGELADAIRQSAGLRASED